MDGGTSVYEAAGGRDGMVRLAAAWHERVLADEHVRSAYLGELDDALVEVA